MTVHLKFGDTISGVIVDGDDDTTYIGATLRLTEEFGVELEIPFVAGHPQFAHISEWFRSRAAPSNLQFATSGGPIYLFGTRWRGHSLTDGNRLPSGRFTAAEVLLWEREGDLEDPFNVMHMRSQLDGLSRWGQRQAVTMDSRHNDDQSVSEVTFTLKPTESVSWRQGDAEMTVTAGWSHIAQRFASGERTTIEDHVTLASSFGAPRAFAEHFVEQRKVANLLVLLYGRPISFREHRVRDERLLMYIGEERPYMPWVEVLSAKTVKELAADSLTLEDLQELLVGIEDLGPAGLEAWSKNYEPWSRFILPAVAVLSNRESYAEDIVTATSIAIEGAARLIGSRPGEEATHRKGRQPESTSTYFYRCLDVLNVHWGGRVSGQVGLSRALASTYNLIKHADRGDYPDDGRTQVASVIGLRIVRLLALTLTGRGEQLLAPYRQQHHAWRVTQRLDAWNLQITDEGDWAPTEPLQRLRNL